MRKISNLEETYGLRPRHKRKERIRLRLLLMNRVYVLPQMYELSTFKNLSSFILEKKRITPNDRND